MSVGKFQIIPITEMHDFINQQPALHTEFDEILSRRMIQKINIFEDYLNLEFKSGVDADIEG
ncbi:hypothetical protein [Neobacillus sp. LXY-1]|uniref:hypothetical protein n=1 Tax=Neobacillus sp. LXY-1 TaxID=3379133 RepID=UPI003EE39361